MMLLLQFRKRIPLLLLFEQLLLSICPLFTLTNFIPASLKPSQELKRVQFSIRKYTSELSIQMQLPEPSLSISKSLII